MNDVNPQSSLIGTRPVRPDGVSKVTGTAKFGNDYDLPGTLAGKVLRSPHPHARIKSIDTSKAEALKGVHAVVTRDDFPEQDFSYVGPARTQINMWHMTRNVLAREKALYEGHAVAAVAAASPSIAAKAVKLIEVEYEVLPHVIDVDEAMKDDAPLLFEDMIPRGYEPEATKPSNISKRVEFAIGDIDAGFAEADVIVEKEFKTAAVHQGYIEPHAALAVWHADGQGEVWCSSQGHFVIRTLTAKICGMNIADLKINPAEIGGGFGGKTIAYLEPVALMLSKKSSRPVRIAMTREEVFRASGPTSGASMWIKIGAKKDGTIVAGDTIYKYQAGAFPGSPVMNGCLCGLAAYNPPNQRSIGYDVVSNRPKVAAYRAPGSPIASYGVESVLDIIAKKIGMDPIALREKNATEQGAQMIDGSKLSHGGFLETVKAIKDHEAYKTELGSNQGRGVASGYWFNGAGESGATVFVNADGTVSIASGSPDIGGSRASMAIMAAETFGINYDDVRSTVNDTTAVPYTHVTGGSRVTYATGMAIIGACNNVIDDLKGRAAKIWDVDVEAVDWLDGHARPAGANVGEFEPLSLKDLATGASGTGGPLGSTKAIAAGGQAPGFATALVDVEVDPETGQSTVLRVVVAQDAGRAIHKSYVEGQYQGGAAQGIGWALNEEYIHNDEGKLENPGFLDYRIPVASDLPFIETVVVEVPNTNHPFGVKGVGEATLCPMMAAVANAVADATGRRLTELPMSPPRVKAAIDDLDGAEL